MNGRKPINYKSWHNRESSLQMKTTIDPRMLENMLASGHFPHTTDWEAWMLRRQNKGKMVLSKTKNYDLLWGHINLLCVSFEAYFSFDPRNHKCSYEYLREEVCLCLQRRANEVVKKQDEEKRSGLSSNRPDSQSHLSKVQFGFCYDVAIQFFGNDLTGSRGFAPFFSRAEAQLNRLKNSHNAPERVR